jgi:hypothetical protein
MGARSPFEILVILRISLKMLSSTKFAGSVLGTPLIISLQRNNIAHTKKIGSLEVLIIIRDYLTLFKSFHSII